MHDNAAQKLAVYVSTTGSDLNSGETPGSSLLTLQAAIAAADKMLAVNWPTVQKGVTINVAPGQYLLSSPLSVPAFGVRIEAYKRVSQPTASVIITGTASWPNQGLINFDRYFGPLSEAVLAGQNPPPSVLRGVSVQTSTGSVSASAAVWIDPTIFGGRDFNQLPIAVEVNQCVLTNGNSGIRIDNSAQRPIAYAGQIVDNEIANCLFGVQSTSWWTESNLFRSNRIHMVRTGMRLRSAAVGAGMAWPRVLSNAVHDVQGDPLAVYPQFGIVIQAGSAQIVNNTVAFVTGSSPNPSRTAGIAYFNGAGGSAGETLVVANNLLYCPAFTIPFTTTSINPNELLLPAGFAGTATVLSNVYDAADPVPAPFLASPTNIATTNPRFANMSSPYDVHVVPPSPAVTNPGDQSYVLPGPASTIVINGVSYPANCALDMDLDARTNQTLVSSTPILHRGADQLVWDSIRLSAPTTGSGTPENYANAIGKVVPDSSGHSKVWLSVDGPRNSYYITFLCSTLPMGPEVQQGVTPWGSLAIDSAPANSVQIGSGFIGSTATQTLFDMGVISPAFLQAEMYLQTLVFRPNNGPVSWSNRIRLDIDKN